MATTGTSHGDQYGPITNRLTDPALLLVWGVVVTAGWLVSQAVALSGSTEPGLQLGLTGFWLVGSLVPITASFLWMRRGATSVYFLLAAAVQGLPMVCHGLRLR